MMGMCFGGLCGGSWGRYERGKGDLNHERRWEIDIDPRGRIENRWIRLY